MRIIVKGETNFKFVFPTGLLLNRVTATLAPYFANDDNIKLTRAQAIAMVKAINYYRRRHKDWKLIEMYDADGEYVEIKL